MTHYPWPTPTELAPARDLSSRIDVHLGVIGAGIHGASLVRELTLRGVSCALVDCGAIGGGTSQWSSKLLHGGIRYLRTGDIRQMREGLQERATWVRIAPHRCQWEAFWMPHHCFWEGAMHRLGIGLYDWWGSERPGWPEASRLGGVPKSHFLQDPRSLNSPFKGATAYADLLTWDGALTRDLAASSEAAILDFHEVENFIQENATLAEAHLRDRRNGECRVLSAKRWVFALGPWTDEAMAKWFGEDQKRLRLSAGIHLWLEAVPGCERPWTIPCPGGRVLFVIPRDGKLLVGTTEREVEKGWVPIVEEEREALFKQLEKNLPGIAWRRLSVLGEELGVRPLVANLKSDTARMSREAALERHPTLSNLTLVLGGKLTTARALMDKLATQLTGKSCPASLTTPLVKSRS